MTKRSDISKQVSKRGGGYPKTGKGTSLKKINKERGQWEMLPGTGTSPYNPPKWRKKKKATVTATPKTRTVTKVRGPEDYASENMAATQHVHQKNKAMRDEFVRLKAERDKRRARASIAALNKPTVRRPLTEELPAIPPTPVKNKGGKVSKKYNTGGRVVYDNHHGGEFVAAGYKEI
tara:strand:- start:126 stop:656 length:531 start_codon:yes stop_codon:yes gene_type:complete